MTQMELEQAKAQLETLRKTVREDLAEDLGGAPEDYNAAGAFDTVASDSDEAVPDGGAGE